MVNPRIRLYVAIVGAVFAFNGLISLWGTIGLWGPVILGLMIVITLRTGVSIGQDMKTLELENRKRKY